MADNGKIIRNGAEIQIDENGNVVARPAAGQEFIVEDDARVGTLEADQLNTPPTGTLVQLDGDQTVANDTLTEVKWVDDNPRGDVANLLSNNAVVVPDGYNYAKVTVQLSWLDATDFDVLTDLVNNSTRSGSLGSFFENPNMNVDSRYWWGQSAWYDVNPGDEHTIEVRHRSGGDREIRDVSGTWMEVLFL